MHSNAEVFERIGIAQVAADGKTRQMDIFNLDATISVGYRVNSIRGTEFRIWATNVLKQHLVQGYTVNEKRLKQLGQVVKLASDISKRKQLSGDEASRSRGNGAKRNGKAHSSSCFIRLGALHRNGSTHHTGCFPVVGRASRLRERA